jgi:hypothetical protein
MESVIPIVDVVIARKTSTGSLFAPSDDCPVIRMATIGPDSTAGKEELIGTLPD